MIHDTVSRGTCSHVNASSAISICRPVEGSTPILYCMWKAAQAKAVSNDTCRAARIGQEAKMQPAKCPKICIQRFKILPAVTNWVWPKRLGMRHCCERADLALHRKLVSALLPYCMTGSRQAPAKAREEFQCMINQTASRYSKRKELRSTASKVSLPTHRRL